MAPGVVCVWSRTDPDAGTQNSDNEDEWTFTDPIASLQGVSRGVRLEAAEQQSVEPPYTHDIPFLTMYELPDVTYHQGKEFKESEEQCSFKEKDGFKSRVYVEVECIEAEGFKGGMTPERNDCESFLTYGSNRPSDRRAFHSSDG
jgi:hypothetical protein